jgi:hypothetical protein
VNASIPPLSRSVKLLITFFLLLGMGIGVLQLTPDSGERRWRSADLDQGCSISINSIGINVMFGPPNPAAAIRIKPEKSSTTAFELGGLGIDLETRVWRNANIQWKYHVLRIPWWLLIAIPEFVRLVLGQGSNKSGPATPGGKEGGRKP